MRAIFRLILCAYLMGSAVALAQMDNPVVRAITQLQNGEGVLAYRGLVQAFRVSRNIEERSKIALLLALSDERAEKIRRHVYADYALQNYSNLDPALVLRLTRVVGDAKLAVKDFDGAKRAYQFILAAPETKEVDREAATHRLGKVYLAEGSEARAFRLWQNWLEQSEDGPLHDAIVYDAGRSFVRALMKGDGPSLRLHLNKKEDQTAFIEGIVSALATSKSANPLQQRILRATQGKSIHAKLQTELSTPLRQARQVRTEAVQPETRRVAMQGPQIDSLLIDFAKMELLNFEERLLEPKRPEARASTAKNRL